MCKQCLQIALSWSCRFSTLNPTGGLPSSTPWAIDPPHMKLPGTATIRKGQVATTVLKFGETVPYKGPKCHRRKVEKFKDCIPVNPVYMAKAS